MKMIMRSIEIDNIRRLSELRIDCINEKGKPYKNIFIQMSNGTGKTTIMELIKGTLCGSAERWTPEKIREFKPEGYNKGDIGTLKLSTQFDNQIFNYILKLDYKDGTAKIYCSNTENGGLGDRRFPGGLNQLFTEDFVNRFVFDGEQAEKTLDSDSREAEEAIKYLHRLDVFDRINDLNAGILKKVQDKQDGARGTDRSVNVLRTKQNKVKHTIEELNKSLKYIEEQLGTLESSREDIETKINALDSKNKELNEQKIKAKERIVECNNQIQDTINDILIKVKSPQMVSETLCNRMRAFGEGMTKLKLPKSSSKDFFIDLAKNEECVCGRRITEKEKNHILEHASKFLGSEQQGILNVVKSGLLECVYDENVEDLFERLKEETAELQKEEGQLISVERKLEKAGGTEAEKLRKQKDDVAEKIAGLKKERDVILSKDDTDSRLTEYNNLNRALREYDRLEDSITSATTTQTARKRKETVEKIVDLMQQEATNNLKKEIIRKANEKIKEVIKDDNIQIESIDNCIKLKGKSGASAGQTLSVAYCFLGTLFEDAELIFPFIIDSPCGSMDLEKRAAVADILPTLFHQTISFVMSSEVDSFANRYYDRTDDTIFYTVKATAGEEKLMVEEGSDFFDSYQRTSKEA